MEAQEMTFYIFATMADKIEIIRMKKSNGIDHGLFAVIWLFIILPYHTLRETFPCSFIAKASPSTIPQCYN